MGLTADRQRIDKWLWHARVVRTRTAAAGLALAGRVRVNGRRIDAPSRLVQAGDVVTVSLDRSTRILKVAAVADRRGSSEAGRRLYEEMTPKPAVEPALEGLQQDAGGRPSAPERGDIDRMLGCKDN